MHARCIYPISIEVILQQLSYTFEAQVRCYHDDRIIVGLDVYGIPIIVYSAYGGIMKKIVLILLLVSSVFVFAQKRGGVLVFARGGDSVGLDPGRETDGESFYATVQIFDRLVDFEPGTSIIQPGLAESWSVSRDGLEYTFKLRRGVSFHDRTEFNADAVVFTFERMFKEDNPYHQFGPWNYFNATIGDSLKSVEAVDNYTVKFTLKTPLAPFVSILAMDFASIVSPAAVRKYGADFFRNPVGTGPFVFVSWQKDSQIVFVRNRRYWREPPYVNRLILRVIPDATARLLALQKGEVDIIDFPSPEDIANISRNDELQLIQQEGFNIGYLAMNIEKEPFDDVRVRQAINYAINKADLIKGVYGNSGVPAKNPMPPSLWSYNDNTRTYDYNPERARLLLRRAGYPNGFSTDIWAIPVVRPYMPNGRRAAEILQAQLKEVNIDAEIKTYDWGTYLDKVFEGEHGMAMLGWTGDYADPDNFLYTLLSEKAAEKPALNIAFWRNKEFNDLILAAQATSDRAERTRLYEEAQEIFVADVPWVPLAHSIVYVAARSNVRGFKLYPTGERVFRDVWFD